MPTPHINAKKGDFSNVVLMPGDPLRAKWIAENYLTDVKQVNDVRGMLGFTGYTKNGKRLSVMASGMGQPSIGIYSHELYTEYDVDTIIRVGTCGAYQPYINLFDVIIGISSSTDSNWIYQYNVPQFSAACDLDLAIAAKQAAEHQGVKTHAGNILAADIFYDEDKEIWKRWARLNVLGVEMESYALYTNAQALRKRALCLLTVTDSFINPEMKATSDQRLLGLGKMIEIAIEAAEKFIK